MTNEEFNTQIENVYESLVAWCLHLVPDPEIARDIAHEAVVRAMENKHTFRYGNFKTWICTIARNYYFNLRDRERSTPFDPQDEGMYDDGVFHPPVPGALELEVGKYLEIRNSLPKKMLETFVLYEEGKKSSDIALELGVPVGTVKSRLYHARQRIIRGLRE